MTASEPQRPITITLIAFLQFAKAWVLLLVAWMVWKAPEALQGSNTAATLVYLAAHGSNPRGVFLAVFTIYPLVIGAGLWFLQPWARYALMVTSGVTVAKWVRFLLLNWAVAGSSLYDPIMEPGNRRDTVLTLILIDAVVFLYLWTGQGVSKAFGIDD